MPLKRGIVMYKRLGRQTVCFESSPRIISHAAIANAEYIYYSSPNTLVYESEQYIEDLGEEAMEVLYPEIENFAQLYNAYAYRNLDSDTLGYITGLWETLKIS